jgi:hypothetical protein
MKLWEAISAFETEVVPSMGEELLMHRYGAVC